MGARAGAPELHAGAGKHRLTTALAAASAPTLLFGEKDLALSTRSLRGYEAYAEDMNVEIVPGCGHFIADERPELVADRARSFLA